MKRARDGKGKAEVRGDGMEFRGFVSVALGGWMPPKFVY